MNYITITSKDNLLLKKITKLQDDASFRKENNACVVEGLRITTDAFENGLAFSNLVVSDTAFLRYESDIKKFATRAKNLVKIPDVLFKRLGDTASPQGVMAVVDLTAKPSFVIKKTGRYIALENVQDPANLGAVARTAEALGIDGIILTNNGCDPYSPKSLRASMGTLLRLPLFITDSMVQFINNSGLTSYACVVHGEAQLIGKINFLSGCVAVIGNEANGLTEETIMSCTHRITIPMTGRAESLNASVAAAVVMWEMCRP